MKESNMKISIIICIIVFIFGTFKINSKNLLENTKNISEKTTKKYIKKPIKKILDYLSKMIELYPKEKDNLIKLKIQIEKQSIKKIVVIYEKFFEEYLRIFEKQKNSKKITFKQKILNNIILMQLNVFKLYNRKKNNKKEQIINYKLLKIIDKQFLGEKNKPKNGEYKEYYKSGKLKTKNYYKNDCRLKTVYYYKNGNKKALLNFNKNGESHGLNKEWYENGV